MYPSGMEQMCLHLKPTAEVDCIVLRLVIRKCQVQTSAGSLALLTGVRGTSQSVHANSGINSRPLLVTSCATQRCQIVLSSEATVSELLVARLDKKNSMV
jgi:hypothetical protein